MSDDPDDPPNEETQSLPSRLLALGDPSGQQTASYWNEWFSVVCSGAVHDDKKDDTISAAGTNFTPPKCTPSSSSSFEWYCDSNPVIEILGHHIPFLKRKSLDFNKNTYSSETMTHSLHTTDETDETNTTSARSVSPCLRLFHPGSGNSLLPFHIRDLLLSQSVYSGSEQVLLDISDLALSQIRRFDEEQRITQNKEKDKNSLSFQMHHIHYRVGDIFQPSSSTATLASNSFDAWIDKGFIDALFSGSDQQLDMEQSSRIFQEAHRILTLDHEWNPNGGCLIVVTLAQDHSLSILLHQWLTLHTETCQPLWNTNLCIYELVPTRVSSCDKRPFAFVLQKNCISNCPSSILPSGKNVSNNTLGLESYPWSVTFHSRKNTPDNDFVQNMDPREGEDEGEENEKHVYDTDTIQFQLDTLPKTSLTSMGPHSTYIDTIYQQVQNRLEKSRVSFQHELEQYHKSKRIIFTKLHIKPSHPNVTLTRLHDDIVTSDWSIPSLSWYPYQQMQNVSTIERKTKESEMKSKNDSLIQPLKYGSIEPIGFGISKLILYCIIDSNVVEELCDQILSKTYPEEGEQPSSTQVHVRIEDSVPSDETRNGKSNTSLSEHAEDECSEEHNSVENETDVDNVIQSIDIDWDSTVPIGNFRDFILS